MAAMAGCPPVETMTVQSPIATQQSFVAAPAMVGGAAGPVVAGGTIGGVNAAQGGFITGPNGGSIAGASYVSGVGGTVAGATPGMAVGPGVGIGMGGAAMGGGTRVPVPADPCGCGPGASAGDCSGTCGGAETVCCEPAGGVAQVQWVQTGYGGAYAPVTSYQFVGEGAGGYERQVVTSWYGWRPRKCCLGLLCCLLLLPLLWLLMNLLNEPSIDPPVAPGNQNEPQGPPGTCIVFGDPHVKTFDNKRADYYTSGEYWIVTSDTVQIQAKYFPTHMTGDLAVTKAIAIGGPFLGGHTLIIDVDRVLFDGRVVQDGFQALGRPPWTNANPAISLVYNSQGTVMQNSRVGKQLHVLHVRLPQNVMLEVNRWAEPSEGKYINVRINMPAQPNQDGHCGNFNGNAADDARVAVRDRVGRTGVPQSALLFPGAKTPVNPGNRPDLNDCPPGLLNVAMEKCKASENTFFPTHACLIDACLGHIGPNAA